MHRIRHLEAVAAWAVAGLVVAVWPSCLASQATPKAPAAERLFNQAQIQERDGDLAGALAGYRGVVDQYPRSPRAPQALLRSARIYYHARQNLREADLVAQRLVADYPDAPQASGGRVLLAAIRSSATAGPADLESERQKLRAVAAQPGPWWAEARVREGDLGLRLGDHAAASAAFFAVIEEARPSRWTARARLGLGHVLLVEGRWQEAAGVLQRLVSDGAEASPARDAAAVRVAQRLLTAIHRLYLRPQGGQSPWARARQVALSGVQLREPSGLAAGAGGRLLVADSGAGTVYLAAPGGAVAERFSAASAGHPAWGPRRPFWSDSGSRPCLAGGSRFHCPGDATAAGFAASGAGGAAAGARGSLGEWLLVGSEGGPVKVWGPAGEARRPLQAGEACDLDIDLRGRIYVLECDDDRVSRYHPDGGREGVAASWKWRRPEAVAVDLLGRVYVLDGRDKRVDVFSAEGSLLSQHGPMLPGGIELRRPIDLALDEEARLYILDAKLGAIVVLE